MNEVDYRCPECDGELTVSFTEMQYSVTEAKVTIKNLPCTRCEKCGMEFISGPVAENADELVDRMINDMERFSKKVVHKQGIREIAVAI